MRISVLVHEVTVEQYISSSFLPPYIHHVYHPFRRNGLVALPIISMFEKQLSYNSRRQIGEQIQPLDHFILRNTLH